jgi:hypothetical protein
MLARVGAVAITEGDLQQAIAQEPEALRDRYKLPEPRRQMLDGMVRFEFLAQASERAGAMKDPKVVRSWRQQAINKFLQDEIGQSTAPLSISSADIAAYYEAHKAAEFSSPPVALADVEEMIRQRLHRERREAALEMLITKLKDDTAVEIYKP